MSNAALGQAHREIQADKKLPSDVRKADPFDAIVAVAKLKNTKHGNTILTSLGRFINDETISHVNGPDYLDIWLTKPVDSAQGYLAIVASPLKKQSGYTAQSVTNVTIDIVSELANDYRLNSRGIPYHTCRSG